MQAIKDIIPAIIISFEVKEAKEEWMIRECKYPQLLTDVEME